MTVNERLVYWCPIAEAHWPLSYGPDCPANDCFYDSRRTHKGRKRLMWVCDDCGQGYFDRTRLCIECGKRWWGE